MHTEQILFTYLRAYRHIYVTTIKETGHEFERALEECGKSWRREESEKVCEYNALCEILRKKISNLGQCLYLNRNYTYLELYLNGMRSSLNQQSCF